ncbi:hypothetical protein E4U17_002050 [Claviceps sp. LM77 group G4]|nr:hypothetical protein E4U17_002050 [Claviceps sp. LM77 group G4]KAG6077570.1 hypothetical protein E4U16_002174 [Claviceps sp. LM84 group G4]KAG6081473.1 hypothetical protein E4U33_006797 [Claviceps sp. LM78 group G4]
MKFFSLITMALSASQTAFAAIGNSWKFTGKPKGGLRDITFPFRMEGATHKEGYFFAQQFSFQGLHSESVCGVKTLPNVGAGRSVIRAVFSTYQPGATTEDSNCRDGVDGGPGVSCTMDFYGDYSAIFDIVIENVGGTTWNATAMNTSTGREIHVGSWTLPSSAGGIESKQYGFVEYTPWNSGRHFCDNLPRTAATMYNPFSRTRGAGTGILNAPYEYLDCVKYMGFSTAKVANGYHIQCGFH